MCTDHNTFHINLTQILHQQLVVCLYCIWAWGGWIPARTLRHLVTFDDLFSVCPWKARESRTGCQEKGQLLTSLGLVVLGHLEIDPNSKGLRVL